MLYSIIHSNVDADLAMFDIIDSDVVRSRGHPLRIVKSHCRINACLYSFVPCNINICSSLHERLVKCGIQFRFSDVTLIGLTLVNLLLTIRVLALPVSVAAYCWCFFLFWGKASVSFYDFPYPVANQWYCFFVFVILYFGLLLINLI